MRALKTAIKKIYYKWETFLATFYSRADIYGDK